MISKRHLTAYCKIIVEGSAFKFISPQNLFYTLSCNCIWLTWLNRELILSNNHVFMFFLPSCTLDSLRGFRVCRRLYRDLLPQFRSSLVKKWHPESSHPSPHLQIIHTSQDFQTHWFNMPVHFADKALFRESRQAWIWLPRSKATHFTSGHGLPRIYIDYLFMHD